MSEQHVRRPGGITLLVVIGIIQGVVAMLGGVFLILDRDSVELQLEVGMSSSQLQGTGIGLILIGGLTLLLAMMLGSGSNVIRWLYGIMAMINVAAGVWGLFSLHGEQQMSAAFSTVFGLIVLWILFGSERTDDFFARQ